MVAEYEELPYPVYPDLIFGEGSIAQLIGVQRDTTAEGDIVILTFRPTKSMRQKWKIDWQKDLDSMGRITKEYPAEYFYPLDNDPKWGCWFLEVDFNGNPTPASRRYEHILTELMTYKKLCNSLKAQLAYIHRQFKLATSEQKEFDKQWLERQKALMSVLKPRTEEEEGYMPAQLERG